MNKHSNILRFRFGAAFLALGFATAFGFAQEADNATTKATDNQAETAPTLSSDGVTKLQSATVGMAATIEQLVIPGGELEVKPLEDREAAMVLRITGVFPHGDSYRYDLEYYGLEPGEFDLRDSLQRKDGSSLDDLPPILVSVVPVLPPGQVRPNAVGPRSAPYLGGYRALWILGGIAWVVGLLLILFGWRGKRGSQAGTVPQPKTLADRLRPSVEGAIAGTLPSDQLAELERLLVAFWRRRLNLQSVEAAEAMKSLREHPEAGQLLNQLEVWLHRPGGGGDVDVGRLLSPYQNLPPEALD